MADRELLESITAFVKAAQKNEPADVILKLMTKLKTSAAPPEDVIRSTKAGMVVGQLRKHQDANIKQAANEIVTKWKKAVEASKKKKEMERGITKSSPAQTPTPAPESAASKTYEGDPLKRKYESDKADINRTGRESRDKCIGLMYNGLAFRSTLPVDTVLTKAVEVEQAAFDAFDGETDKYKTKMRVLFMNLKNRTNPKLATRVLGNEITADKFVRMDEAELKSAELRKLEEVLKKDNMNKAQVPMAEKSISDALECGKCKQKKVSYSQAQTRSADEPMTTFCECMACGHRWKFS